ncbi:MAG: PfkB family carbohydrate kinase [Gemmatimonadota bacterium]
MDMGVGAGPDPGGKRPDMVGLGTVALDTLESPAGRVEEVPGGSALYFGAAAASYGAVGLIGAVGEDFPMATLEGLAARGVDTRGLRRVAGPTFRWSARYDGSGRREVLRSVRNPNARPIFPDLAAYRDPPVLFLGSIDPRVQEEVLRESGSPGVVLLDTMSHWILERRPEVERLLASADVLLLNEEELLLLVDGGDQRAVPPVEGSGAAADEGGGAAARTEASMAAALLRRGPRWVIVKAGACGARGYTSYGCVEVAAVAVDSIVDPTGAGDAFAGGVAGVLAGEGEAGAPAGASPLPTALDLLEKALREGVRMGARAVSAFSLGGFLDPDPGGGEQAPP